MRIAKFLTCFFLLALSGSYDASSQVFVYENFESGTNDDCDCPVNFNCTGDAGRAVVGIHPNYTPAAPTCSLSGKAYTTVQGANSGSGALFYYSGGDRLVSDPIEIPTAGLITFSVWYAGPKGNEISQGQFEEEAFFTFGMDNERVGPEFVPGSSNWTEVCFGMEVEAGFHTFELFTGDGAQYTIWFDDFQVSRIDQFEFLGNDTILCAGDSLTLSIPGDIGNFEWNNGSTDTNLLVTESGEYSLSIGVGCEQYVNDIIVEFISLENVNIPNDTFLCDGQDILIELELPDDVNIEWQDGSTDENYTISEEGLYILELTNGCGTNRDSFYTTVAEDFNFSLGTDQTLCSGTELVLEAPVLNHASYSWSNGSDSSAIVIDSSGIYSIFVTNGCFDHSDEINVEFVASSGFDFGENVQICEGDILEFVCPPNASCIWSDGSQETNFSITDTGFYFVEITEPCGTYIDSLRVDFGENISVSADSIVLCEGDSVFLFDITTEFNVEWANSSSNFIIPEETGCYEYRITGSCNESLDCIYIELVPKISIDLGIDEVLCFGETKILESNNLLNYSWSTGQVSENIAITQSGSYWLNSFNSCFNSSDTIKVDFKVCKECNVFIPNIFSPNDNFENDFFQVFSECPVENSRLSIFNRWGEQIFSSEDIFQGWDGRYKGDPAESGVYIYHFVYSIDGEDFTITGDITLVR